MWGSAETSKMMVNEVFKLNRYPIQKIEDRFTGLRGGNTFTKLDMTNAFQQLVLDEDSKKLLFMKTHKGLFRYNWLPFRVSSALRIYQRIMETLLHVIPNVVELGDILVTGATAEA